MQAILLNRTGGPDVLRPEEIDPPVPGPGELLVEVSAAGVNFIDTYHRSGAYPLDLPVTLGLEGAGTVRQIGEGVQGHAVGHRVAWAGTLGSYARFLAVPAERTVRVPDGVTDESAAAVMLQGMTAHYLAHSTYALSEEDTALVYAAAGGVGRLLVQMAKLQGARVIACTSTAEKQEEVRSLGADDVIRYRDVRVPDAVKAMTDGRGVDVVYDSVGADTFDDSLHALRPRGMMVLYGQSSGPVPPVDLQLLNRRGSLFATRPSLFHYVSTPEALQARGEAVLGLVEAGRLTVRIHQRYPLEEASGAHRDLESGTTMGKLILRP